MPSDPFNKLFSKNNENYFSLMGIALVVFVLIITNVIILLMHRILGIEKPTELLFFISRLFYWVCLMVVWYYAIKVEKRPFLLWKEKSYSLIKYFLFILVIFFTIILGSSIIVTLIKLTGSDKTSESLIEILSLFRDNTPLAFFTAITAGVTEELLMRGYLQPRFEMIVNNKWFSIIVTSVLFGLLHYGYGTIINVVGPVFIGFIFAVFYQRFRNIKILIAFHVLWDLLAIFMNLRQMKG